MDGITPAKALPTHCHVPERWPHGWPGCSLLPINPRHLIRPNPMYLVTLPGRWLFFWSDPRKDGCTEPDVEGTDFINVRPRVEAWLSAPVESIVLAQNKPRPTKFQAFWSELDVPPAWEIVHGVAEVWATWEAYERRIGLADRRSV